MLGRANQDPPWNTECGHCHADGMGIEDTEKVYILEGNQGPIAGEQ